MDIFVAINRDQDGEVVGAWTDERTAYEFCCGLLGCPKPIDQYNTFELIDIANENNYFVEMCNLI